MKNQEVLILNSEIFNFASVEKRMPFTKGEFPFEVFELADINIEGIKKENERILSLIKKVIPEIGDRFQFAEVLTNKEGKKVMEAKSRFEIETFTTLPDLTGCKMTAFERQLIKSWTAK